MQAYLLLGGSFHRSAANTSAWDLEGKTTDLSCITPSWRAKSTHRANGSTRIPGFGGVLNRLAGAQPNVTLWYKSPEAL